MTKPLRNQRILITGAAVRIGRAIAEALAGAGAQVLLHCNRSRRPAEEVLEALGGPPNGHEVVQADLTAPGVAENLIENLTAEKPLNALVNSASVYRRTPLAELDDERLRDDFSVNFFAPFALMRTFRTHCKTGAVVNLLDQRIASNDPHAGGYGLAKKTLEHATRAAALEWAPDIRVNGIAPGYVLPPPGVSENAMQTLLESVPMRCRSLPEEIAQGCLFLLSCPTITGDVLFIDGGQHLTGVPPPEIQKSRPRIQ